ncbi:hypothetical protein [Pseudomonas sp. Pseu.R1]|uniref:hypothetical protein n=1 Tax=Pseudomonas sp. Pseu.R1 TaxID=3379818 RepID=UPI003B9518E0
MRNNKTHERLVQLIIEHHTESPGTSLGVKMLSVRAGISRQAFHRYYGDLKDYASGAKPLADLLSGTGTLLAYELINQNQVTIQNLQDQLKLVESKHEKKMQEALKNHITTLMIGDITAHAANDVRANLERQSLYANEMKVQNNQLELELSRAKLALENERLGINGSKDGAATGSGPKFKVDLDLTAAIKAYASSGEIDDFYDEKDRALEIAYKSIKALAADSGCSIIIFAERYVSRFSIFFDSFKPSDSSKHIIVRLPIFDKKMLSTFISKLPPTKKVSVHIPYMLSDKETSGQRKFFFSNIPSQELGQADNADLISIAHGYEEVRHFKVRQGD